MSLTAIGFILYYIASVVLAFAKHPRWGFYAYIAVTVVDPDSKWWGQSLPGVRWSLVAALVFTAAIMVHGKRFRGSPWLEGSIGKLFLTYVIWMWIQVAWAFPGHIDGCILFTKYAILMWAVGRLLTESAELKKLMVVHMLGCLYLGYLVYIAPEVGRIEGIGGAGFDDANTLGSVLGTGLLCAGTIFFFTRKLPRVALLACGAVIANGFVQTQSRGALAGLLVGGLSFYIFVGSAERRRIWPLMALAAVLAPHFVPDSYFERMTKTVEGIQGETTLDESASSRTEIFKAQMRMFADHPFGVGFRGTARLSPAYLDSRYLSRNLGARASHNSFGTVMVDQGLPGIILYLWLVVRVLGLANRLRHRSENPNTRLIGGGVVGCLVLTFVGGLASNFFYLEVQYWFLAALVALGYLNERASTSGTLPFPANARGAYGGGNPIQTP